MERVSRRGDRAGSTSLPRARLLGGGSCGIVRSGTRGVKCAIVLGVGNAGSGAFHVRQRGDSCPVRYSGDGDPRRCSASRPASSLRWLERCFTVLGGGFGDSARFSGETVLGSFGDCARFSAETVLGSFGDCDFSGETVLGSFGDCARFSGETLLGSFGDCARFSGEILLGSFGDSASCGF